MKRMPSPQKRPDLYDDFDGINRPRGWKNPVGSSDRLKQRVAKRVSRSKAEA